MKRLGRPPAPRPFPAEPLERLRPIDAHITGWKERQKMRNQGLTVAEADRLATAAGYHPAQIWGDLWHQMVDVRDDTDLLFRRLRLELGIKAG